MKCLWCSNDTNKPYWEGRYCSERCRHAHESSKQKNQQQPTIIQNVTKVEKEYVYVDRTSNEEKEQMRANAELARQRARQIKREQDIIDQKKSEQEERESKKWILFGLLFLWIALNWATFGDLEAWIISNLFILFYVIYFFFRKKTKKIGQWLDDKLN